MLAFNDDGYGAICKIQLQFTFWKCCNRVRDNNFEKCQDKVQ